MKKHHLIGLLAVVMAVIVAILTPGCGNRREVSEEEARAIAAAVVSQVAGSRIGLENPVETNFSMIVHVDVSASMNGYAVTDSRNPDNTFINVIDYFKRRWNARLHAISEKLDKDIYPESVDYFRHQENYFGEHYMADTIRKFIPETNSMHVLVTDSQPWDSGNQPAYEKVASAITDFMSTGGRCVMIIYRSTYTGYYSSPLLPVSSNLVFYSTTNRPFTVWIFAPRRSALSAVISELEKKSDLKFEHKIQFGEPNLVPVLRDTARSEEKNEVIGRIKDLKTGVEVDRVKDYQQIEIYNEAIKEGGYVNLQFDLFPTNNLLGRSFSNLASQIWVVLDCWELADKKPDKETKESKEPNKESNKETNNPARAVFPTNRDVVLLNIPATDKCPAKQIEMKKLRRQMVEFTLYTTKDTNAKEIHITNAVAIPRLVVPVKRPGDANRYAWVLSLLPRNPSISDLMPPIYSTPDDRQKEHSDRILKLDEMLNIVVTQTEKMGTILFLTEFPITRAK